MKKKKKKQEPIFSVLEEIRVEKAGKNFSEPARLPQEIEEPAKTPAFLQPETFPVVSPEPSQSLSSPTGLFLFSEQTAVSPGQENSEEIPTAALTELTAAATSTIPAETSAAPNIALSDMQQTILLEKKEAQEIQEKTLSCKVQPEAVLSSVTSETMLLTAEEIEEAEAVTAFSPPELSEKILLMEPDPLAEDQEVIFSEREKAEGKTISCLLEHGADTGPATPAETIASPDVSFSCEAESIPPISTPSLPNFSFAFISPGSFFMGSPETEAGRGEDELQNEVKITKDFFIQTTPVTQGQWKTVMGTNPSRFSSQGDDCPVESVSWYDCQKFIEVLNNIGEHTYRLPTEAEWEYACRAEKFSSCSEGEISELFCNYDPNLDAVGWYCGNSSRATQPVGQKQPNSWGLYDVHGNVLEWCQDWYGPYPAVSQTDPSGPVTGPGRVIRGGSWFSNAKSCRSAARFYWSPNAKSDFIGFRLVRE